MTAPKKIPQADLVAFLRWACTQPSNILVDPEDQREAEAIVAELANVLESDPRNTLAGLILDSTGMDDLTEKDVAALYGSFCADRHSGVK